MNNIQRSNKLSYKVAFFLIQIPYIYKHKEINDMKYEAIKGYLLLKGFLFKSNNQYEIFFSKNLDTFIYFSEDGQLLKIHYYYRRDRNINITKFKNLPFTLSKNYEYDSYWLEVHPLVNGSAFINNELYFEPEKGKSFPIKLNLKDFLKCLKEYAL